MYPIVVPYLMYHLPVSSLLWSLQPLVMTPENAPLAHKYPNRPVLQQEDRDGAEVDDIVEADEDSDEGFTVRELTPKWPCQLILLI